MSPKFKDIDGRVFRILSNEEDRMHIHNPLVMKRFEGEEME